MRRAFGVSPTPAGNVITAWVFIWATKRSFYIFGQWAPAGSISYLLFFLDEAGTGVAPCLAPAYTALHRLT